MTASLGFRNRAIILRVKTLSINKLKCTWLIQTLRRFHFRSFFILSIKICRWLVGWSLNLPICLLVSLSSLRRSLWIWPSMSLKNYVTSTLNLTVYQFTKIRQSDLFLALYFFFYDHFFILPPSLWFLIFSLFAFVNMSRISNSLFF